MNRKYYSGKHNTRQNHEVMDLHLWAFCCVSYSIHELPYQKIPLNKDMKYSTSLAVLWITDLGKDNSPCTTIFLMEKITFPFPFQTFLSLSHSFLWGHQKHWGCCYKSMAFPTAEDWKEIVLDWKTLFWFMCLCHTSARDK